MSINNGTDVEDPDYPTTFNCNDVYELVADTTDGPNPYGQGRTNYGATSQILPTEDFYEGATTLLNQKLILPKEIKSPFDIRYKSNYFPLSGKNVGKVQTPRYLRTVDGDEEIPIKFPHGFIPPPNPGDYYLEAFLLTVPRMNQHCEHVNKFQLDHTNATVLDKNPYIIPLTLQNFIDGEIRVKLVLIKTRKSELENTKCLPLFGELAVSNGITDCKSVEDLKETYALNRAVLAFSLGCFYTDDRFRRFTKTTVMSNELDEIEQSEEANNVTCPECSHRFNVKEQKKTAKKRSAPSSNAPNKKRSS